MPTTYSILKRVSGRVTTAISYLDLPLKNLALPYLKSHYASLFVTSTEVQLTCGDRDRGVEILIASCLFACFNGFSLG